MKMVIIGGVTRVFSGALATKLGYGLDSLMGLFIVLLPVIALNVGYLMGRLNK